MSQIEFLDIVDKDDNIIGTTSKEDIYKKSLGHRICHIIIFNNDGKMVLQKRSSKVSFCPDHWSAAVGGHVQSGETYEQAALREYEEELGVKSELELVGKDLYCTTNIPYKFLTTFKTSYGGQFNPDIEVVSEVRSFDMEDIKKMISDGEKFHPELLFILEKYYF